MRNGNFGKSKPIGEGASESKIDLGPGYRIYYGVDGANIILLLGGDKSTQVADIKVAKALWADYRERKNMSDYREDLLKDLADPEYAAQYITAARRESRGAFLVALKDVADAMFGMSKLAENVSANRVSLYRALSESGNPTLSTLDSITGALALDVVFRPTHRQTTTETRYKQSSRDSSVPTIIIDSSKGTESPKGIRDDILPSVGITQGAALRLGALSGFGLSGSRELAPHHLNVTTALAIPYLKQPMPAPSANLIQTRPHVEP